jgi:hypothetical protein
MGAFDLLGIYEIKLLWVNQPSILQLLQLIQIGFGENGHNFISK